MNELLCPNCKSVKHTVFCLTSNPPRFEYQCNSCGHSLKYHERDNSFLPVTQMELDFKYTDMKGSVQ